MTCANTVSALQATTFEVSALSCCDAVVAPTPDQSYVADNFVPKELSLKQSGPSNFPPVIDDDPPTLNLIVPENFVAYPNDPNGTTGVGFEARPEIPIVLIPLPIDPPSHIPTPPYGTVIDVE